MPVSILSSIKLRLTLGLLAVYFLSLQAGANEPCRDWFDRTKINSDSSDCELECASSKVDMGTFDCPIRCPKFCKPQIPKCILEPYWDRALTSDSKPLKKLTADQASRIRKVLSKMPKSFRPRSLKGIVTTTVPFDMFNPSNVASSSDEYLILFPRAFSDEENLERIIAHEIVHHIIRKEWAQELKSYSKDSGWGSATDSGPRPGGFVEADGRQSPEEDFANNAEYYLFEPTLLKKTSPKIFSWIEKNLGSRLKLEKGCK